MRAVSGVVLRRDLSLSRRLYTWLLGSSDSSETQIQHLKDHGLELLHLALKVRYSFCGQIRYLTDRLDGYECSIDRNR